MSMDSIKEKLTYIMEALNNSRLEKGLEAGYRVGNPGGFTQGAALQIEDLSPVMYTATYQDKHLFLTKQLTEKKQNQ